MYCTQDFLFFPFFSAAQDAGLDALSAVISRQKIMGQEIGNELDEHNGKVYFECVPERLSKKENNPFGIT